MFYFAWVHHAVLSASSQRIGISYIDRTKLQQVISFTQMIDTNEVEAGLAKSLEYPAINDA